MNETKFRILEAAERLVAEHGPDVSLRAITAAAGVNLAAVNYHFQSKEALYETLVARRFDPINQLRFERLSALETLHPAGEIPLEKVLDAFLSPILDCAGQDPERYRPLLGRLFSLPDEHTKRIFSRHIAPVMARFEPAFARAVPGLSGADLMWRTVFAVGTVIHVLNCSKVIAVATLGKIDPADLASLKRQVIAFTAAGFRAPLVGIAEGDQK